MFRLLAGVALLAVVAVLAVPEIDRLADRTADAHAEAPAAGDRPSGYRTEIAARSDGHFTVEARIDGRRVPMLVDTGATRVTLTGSDARAVGLLLLDSDFRVPMSTANGTVGAASVHLDELAVDGVRLRNVDAFVLPDRALSVSLLGMSFLGRLSHYEVSSGRLLLQQ